VDLWPDDWLGGIGNLSIPARGVYLTACLLIYSHGGPIEREHLRQMCPSRSRQFGPALNELIQRNKLLLLDGDRLDQRRCEVEISRARARIKAAQGSANERWNPPVDNPAATDNEPANGQLMASYLPANRQLIDGELNENNKVGDANAMLGVAKKPNKKVKNLKGELGCASREPEAPPEPPSAEDIAAVDAIVAGVRDVLALPATGLRNGTYNADAYRQAIRAAKRDQWLNNLATWAGEALPGLPEKMAAWEAIEAARNAGSRDATPPDIRRAVDALSRLRETSVAYAEAAE
jgi:uncharacterized protein YdaU (DUF1376 family)